MTQPQPCTARYCHRDAVNGTFRCATHPSEDERLARLAPRLPSYEFVCLACGREAELNGTNNIRLSDVQAAAVKPAQCGVCGGRMLLTRSDIAHMSASNPSIPAPIATRPGYKVAR